MYEKFQKDIGLAKKEKGVFLFVIASLP